MTRLQKCDRGFVYALLLDSFCQKNALYFLYIKTRIYGLMKKLFLLFSHTLTNNQIDDAKNSLGIDEFVMLSSELQVLWSNVPPRLEDLVGYLQSIRNFLIENLDADDLVLIQGDFGATCSMVSFVKSLGFDAVYATTQRELLELKDNDAKVVKTSVFSHVRFRQY